MKSKLMIATVLGVLTLLVMGSQAFAHNLWLNPGDYYPKVGSTVDIGIGWGHKYPANRVHQEVKEGRVAEIRAVDPDGLMVDLVKASVSLYRLKVEKAGVYLVLAKIKSGVFTKTPEGRKWADKKSVAHPIKCINFHIMAKTVIIAGGEGKNLENTTGLPLELIPLANLQNLKSGDKLGVKVLFNDKPLPNAAVKATYAGFDAEDIAPHSPSQKGQKGHGKRFPVETVTDDQGKTVVPFDKDGYWMILLTHRPPYPDKETCDEYMYKTTLTFQVKAK